jgi:hypothetical protein
MQPRLGEDHSLKYHNEMKAVVQQNGHMQTGSFRPEGVWVLRSFTPTTMPPGQHYILLILQRRW